MAEAKYKMSRERYEQLVQELEYMQTVGEKEVSEEIKEARSYGDLSENSEYDEAKEKQGKLYSRIAEFKNLIENAEIVEHGGHSEGKVGIGSVVRVLDCEFNEEETYTIVGSQEVDAIANRISDDSPLGRAMIGKTAGDKITVSAPAGELEYTILEVSF